LTSTTPIIPERSRSTTPIVPERETVTPFVEQQINYELNPIKTAVKQFESILVKQGKQIRALYELQKSTNEKVTWIQNQFNKQDEGKNNDLSPKVFGVS